MNVLGYCAVKKQDCHMFSAHIPLFGSPSTGCKWPDLVEASAWLDVFLFAPRVISWQDSFIHPRHVPLTFSHDLNYGCMPAYLLSIQRIGCIAIGSACVFIYIVWLKHLWVKKKITFLTRYVKQRSFTQQYWNLRFFKTFFIILQDPCAVTLITSWMFWCVSVSVSFTSIIYVYGL